MIYWHSLSDFLAMGSHGLYVWGSFIVMAALMILEPVLLVRGRKSLIARLKRQYRAEKLDRRAAGASSASHSTMLEESH
ncbi:heme exporter protein CcmD [Propionivibrio sp.]|jgi:heme exporter protein D|uniref:heme exporter protein CcmD n=1 Tax=Propionivibrio sp. TaxID=2212460 RepID=UPI0039E513FD